MDTTLRQISTSLGDLDSYDSDLRFMALNDIYNILHEDRTARALASQRVLSRVSTGILKSLEDQNTEVQNQAVKALGALIVIFEREVRTILSQLLQSESAVKDLAIRAVLTNVSNSAGNSEIIISMILPVVTANHEPSIDSTDALLELVRGYGTGFSPQDVASIFETTKNIAENPSGLISKRAFDTLQELAPLVDDPLFDEIVAYASNLEHKPNRLRIAAMNMLSCLVEAYIGRFSDQQAPVDLAITYTREINEDTIDLVEAALALLKSLVKESVTQNSSIASTIAESINYNPNLGDGDLDDGMEDYSDFADSEIEGDFDDDTEDSWKVRRMAVRVVAAMLQSGDFQSAAEFVPLLMQTLANESTDAAKQEILACLALFADPCSSDQPKRRGSNTSMRTSDGVLSEYVEKIVQMAKSDAENISYLPLISKLYKNYEVPHTPAIVSLCLYRVETFRSQQILQCLEVVNSILNNSTDFDPRDILKIIRNGLGQSLFKVQSLALADARLLNSLEILPDIEHTIVEGVSTTIRAAAMEAAAEILTSNIENGPIDEFAQLSTRVLHSDPEQRVTTINSLISLFKSNARISDQTLQNLTLQVLDLFSATAPSITCACLELIDLISTPETANDIALKVLTLPNHPEFIDLKCKTLSHAPQLPQVLDFALEITKLRDPQAIKVPERGEQPSPLITLYAEITKSVPGVLQSVSKVYSENAIWAEVIAEIIYISDAPTPPEPKPLTNWFASVALFLTLHGRHVFEGEFDTTGVEPITAGYCLGATTINSNSAQEFLYTASTQIAEKPEVVLSAVEVILMRTELNADAIEKAWEAAELLTRQQFTQKEGLDILSRIIGALYVETSNPTRFNQWDNTLPGINAAKAAFSLTKSEDQQIFLIHKFIQGMDSDDINIRSSAAKSFAWITQIQPAVVEPFTNQVMETALKYTGKDMSLVRLAQIGPYKHEIDDGLDFRKACYELIYMCISNFSSIDVSGDVWVPVLQGLAEKEDHDIKMLTCLIIQLIAEKNIYTIVRHLTEIMQLFTTTENLTVKENGIKLEHDKKATISRQISICTEAIQQAIENAHINDTKIKHLLDPKQYPVG